MLTDGATATVVGGGAEDFGAGCAAGVVVDRAWLDAALPAFAGTVLRATRSAGGGRCGLGAGCSDFFGDDSVTVGDGALSMRPTGVVGAGTAAGAEDATRPAAAPAAESGVVRASCGVGRAVVAAGEPPFAIWVQTRTTSTTVTSTPPAMSSRRSIRTRAACFDFRIACSTVELSDTVDGYAGPLSIARTPLRSFAMSSAL